MLSTPGTSCAWRDATASWNYVWLARYFLDIYGSGAMLYITPPPPPLKNSLYEVGNRCAVSAKCSFRASPKPGRTKTQLASNLVHALGRVLAVFTPEDFQSLENQRKRIFLCRSVGRGFRPTIGGSPPNPGAPYYADAECPRFALTGGAPRRFCPKSGGKTRSRFHRKPSGCGESHWRRKLRLMRLKSAQRSASKITPFIFSARSRKGRRVHEHTSAPPAITSAPPAHQNFFKKARLPFL
jgi:hypothetical protein